MPLPPFEFGDDLPPGVHLATLPEVVDHFGSGTAQRVEVTTRLLRIHELAMATGYLERFIIFGSYVTRKPAPNDIDIFLVMSSDFDVDGYIGLTRLLFEHEKADVEFGASIFWASLKLPVDWIQSLVDGWQNTRETTRRGIVEVVP
jgi:hypothetical protein